MKITGTLINYYFHCKRQCWLLSNRINLEDNSEDVHIGRVLHEIREDRNKRSEVKIDSIKVDNITDEYIVEFKKSDADLEAAKWQILLYMQILKNKGIYRKGKLEFYQKKKQDKKVIYLELDEREEAELEKLKEEIVDLTNSDIAPEPLKENKCKKCAYYEYCYI